MEVSNGMNKKSGFALVFAIIIMSLIMAVMASFFAITTSDLALENTTANGIRAYYLAEAGIARKFVDLRSGNTSSLSTQTVTLSAGNTGTYEVTVTPVSGYSLPAYKLDSAGTYMNISKTISLTVRQTTYANYMLLSAKSGYSFKGGDIIRGPVHTNGGLYIDGNPVFEDPVSSVSPSINYAQGGPPLDNPDFRKGLTLAAPSIAMRSQPNPVSASKVTAQQVGGLYLTGTTSIRLLSNGTMNITNATKGWTNRNVSLPANNVLFVDGAVIISGILKGRLTVGADNIISITDNILYAKNPRTNPASTDMLALVSWADVFIGVNAPYNLEIDAYIVTLDHPYFYWLGVPISSPNPATKRGKLTVYGGMAQDYDASISTRFGYANQRLYTEDYYYDTRTENTPPACFPPLKDAAGRLVYLKTQWAEL
jgi:hypothetical protein